MPEEFIEDLPRQQSYLEFFFHSLGWRYSLLLPMAALAAFVLVLVLVIRGKGNSLPAALILIVPLPIFVAIMGVVDGMLASFAVISMSDTAPKPSVWAEGISMSLVTVLVGMMLAVPGYLLAVVGTSIRSLRGDASQPSPDRAIQATIVEPKR